LTGERQQKQIQAMRHAFVEIQRAADKFAQRHRIGIVINYHPVDDTNIMSVKDAKALLQQDVIYHDRIDITRTLTP
ncbi:MAG: hypothetical protein KDA41_13055, partial [Planctomycetales bacterium]|nr:hypothetical protein [Planctomycetales bacterium]